MSGSERRPLADRLWEKVDASGGRDACWPFRGAYHEDGYGYMTVWVGDRWRHAVGAHRVAYMVTHDLNELPKGIIRHSCDNPPCCNPAHLLAGTVADNVRDCVERGRHAYRENPRPGAQNGRSKLTDDDVRYIRRLVAEGFSKASVGRTFGVSDVMIGRIAPPSLEPRRMSGSERFPIADYQPFMGACRSCKARVIWAVTDAGKRMPVNPEPVDGGNIELLLDLDEVTLQIQVVHPTQAAIFGAPDRYVSHFATCPAAAKFRKPR